MFEVSIFSCRHWSITAERFRILDSLAIAKILLEDLKLAVLNMAHKMAVTSEGGWDFPLSRAYPNSAIASLKQKWPTAIDQAGSMRKKIVKKVI